jgi:hypothetical protein
MPASHAPPIQFRNDNSGTVPSHGIIEITGASTFSDGTPFLTANQPDDDDGAQFNHYVNSHRPVLTGDYGVCYSPIFPVWVAYDSAETPAFGENWGPSDGTWIIKKDSGGFLILGSPDTTDERVLAVQKPGCDLQNAIMQITVLGSPTGGTFDLDLTVDSSEETLTFNYDDAAAAVKTELETHTKIAVDDVTVTAGPFPDATMQVEFVEDLKNTNIALPTADWDLLTGGSGTAVISSYAQLGIAL